jgi:hypothetical protein
VRFNDIILEDMLTLIATLIVVRMMLNSGWFMGLMQRYTYVASSLIKR